MFVHGRYYLVIYFENIPVKLFYSETFVTHLGLILHMSLKQGFPNAM